MLKITQFLERIYDIIQGPEPIRGLENLVAGISTADDLESLLQHMNLERWQRVVHRKRAIAPRLKLALAAVLGIVGFLLLVIIFRPIIITIMTSPPTPTLIPSSTPLPPPTPIPSSTPTPEPTPTSEPTPTPTLSPFFIRPEKINPPAPAAFDLAWQNKVVSWEVIIEPGVYGLYVLYVLNETPNSTSELTAKVLLNDGNISPSWGSGKIYFSENLIISTTTKKIASPSPYWVLVGFYEVQSTGRLEMSIESGNSVTWLLGRLTQDQVNILRELPSDGGTLLALYDNTSGVLYDSGWKKQDDILGKLKRGEDPQAWANSYYETDDTHQFCFPAVNLLTDKKYNIYIRAISKGNELQLVNSDGVRTPYDINDSSNFSWQIININIDEKTKNNQKSLLRYLCTAQTIKIDALAIFEYPEN